MSMLVKDAEGHSYRPTGEFRRPLTGEYSWDAALSVMDMHPYSAHPHAVNFGPMGSARIILERVEPRYAVTVMLSQEQFDHLKEHDPKLTACDAPVIMEGLTEGLLAAVANGRYTLAEEE